MGGTEKAKRTPESPRAGNRVQVEIRPARIATGECRLRLGYAEMELRVRELHRARQMQVARICISEGDSWEKGLISPLANGVAGTISN